MELSLQPTLENEQYLLRPLHQRDFEALYRVAADPRIWEQHPNRERYKKPVFQNFFEGALESGGAFLVIDKPTNEILGSTRFYDLDETQKTILIGYTFYRTSSWGKGVNPAVKKLMLDYIFKYVDRVLFHVGKDNRRSRKAMEKLGAVCIGEEEIAYYGEDSKVNAVYEIHRKDWAK